MMLFICNIYPNHSPGLSRSLPVSRVVHQISCLVNKKKTNFFLYNQLRFGPQTSENPQNFFFQFLLQLPRNIFVNQSVNFAQKVEEHQFAGGEGGGPFLMRLHRIDTQENQTLQRII